MTARSVLAEPSNDLEALTLGLVLAITAPTGDDSLEALAHCERLAGGMTPEDVAEAKRQARAHCGLTETPEEAN